jgi:sorbitol-specific phosphotransferase system component IIC
MNLQSKPRRISAWILTTLITLLFVFSAVAKLLGAAQVVDVFQKWGLGDRIVLIGIGELVSALLFFIPRTNSLGVLLLSGYMGGAIVTHMQHAEPFYGQSVLLLLIWIAGYLRHPELLQSFRTASE